MAEYTRILTVKMDMLITRSLFLCNSCRMFENFDDVPKSEGCL